MLHNIRHHLENHIPHVVAVQHFAALRIDDLPLFIGYLIVFQQVLTDTVVVVLDFLLCLLDGAGQHLVFNLLSLRHSQCIEHVHQTV